jgi:O-antigen/teichoic acid export membrane protein
VFIVSNNIVSTEDRTPSILASETQTGSTQRHKLVRNAFFNSSAWAANVVVNLVMVPLLIHFLGVEGYGIFALLTGLFGYFSLLDFGMAQGVVRYVAHYTGLKDSRSIVLAINSALAMQIGLGGLGLAILWIFNKDLIHLLQMSPAQREVASDALYLSAVGFFVTMLMGTFSSALMGVQRYDVVGKTTFAISIITSALSVGVLLLGGRLFELILVNLLSSVGTLVVLVYLSYRLIPGMALFRGMNVRLLREMFSFSKYAFLSQVSGFLYNTLARYVIGILKGPEAVAYFVVPMKLVTAFSGGFGSLANVLFPFASDLAAQGKREELTNVYLKASRYFLALSIPLYLMVAVFSKEILSVWVGEGFAMHTWPVLMILSVGFWFSAWTMIPSNVVTGIGYARITGLFSLAVALLSILLVVFLVPGLDILGASVGLLIIPLFVAPVFVWYVTVRMLKLDVAQYADQVVLPCLLPCAAYAAATILIKVLSQLTLSIPSMAWLVAALVLLLPYLIFARRLRVLSPPDLLAALRGTT